MKVSMLAVYAACLATAVSAQEIPREIDGRKVVARGISYDFPAELRPMVDRYSHCLFTERSRLSSSGAVRNVEVAIAKCKSTRAAAHNDGLIALSRSAEWPDETLRQKEVTTVLDKMEASALHEAAEIDAYLKKQLGRGGL